MQDLENHTLMFAKAVRTFVKSLPMTVSNVEDIKELVGSSGAIGATYIAAHSSVNKRDFLIGLKNCVKEARTTRYWLQLVDTQNQAQLDQQRNKLIAACEELGQVFDKLAAQIQQQA